MLSDPATSPRLLRRPQVHAAHLTTWAAAFEQGTSTSREALPLSFDPYVSHEDMSFTNDRWWAPSLQERRGAQRSIIRSLRSMRVTDELAADMDKAETILSEVISDITKGCYFALA